MTALAMTMLVPVGVSLNDVARELAPLGARLTGDGSVRVTGVWQDSRRVEPGDLVRRAQREAGVRSRFRARRAGSRGGGVARGGGQCSARGSACRCSKRSDARAAIGRAAEWVYGQPSRTLALVGITGTNGKTMTSVLIEHALAVLGGRPARLGTLGFAFGGREQAGSMITPEADDVSRALARVVAQGGSHFVMEVSSHALARAGRRSTSRSPPSPT